MIAATGWAIIIRASMKTPLVVERSVEGAEAHRPKAVQDGVAAGLVAVAAVLTGSTNQLGPIPLVHTSSGPAFVLVMKRRKV